MTRGPDSSIYGTWHKDHVPVNVRRGPRTPHHAPRPIAHCPLPRGPGSSFISQVAVTTGRTARIRGQVAEIGAWVEFCSDDDDGFLSGGVALNCAHPYSRVCRDTPLSSVYVPSQLCQASMLGPGHGGKAKALVTFSSNSNGTNRNRLRSIYPQLFYFFVCPNVCCESTTGGRILRRTPVSLVPIYIFRLKNVSFSKHKSI